MVKIDVREIEKLAKRKLNRRDFRDQFLRQLVTSTEAYAGVVWDCSSLPYRAICQHSLTEPKSIPISNEDHIKILLSAASQNDCVVVRLNQAADSQSPFLFLAPIAVDENQRELVELIVPSELGEEFGPELQSAINTACGIASFRYETEFTSTDSVTEFHADPAVEKFSQFVRAIHQSIDRSLTCRDIANESQRLLDCDRVSVLLRKSGKLKMHAISGQVSVNRRSNTVRILEQLAKKTLKTETRFWYPDDSEIAPQIDVLLDEYLTISATRSLVIVPVFEKAQALVEDPETHEKKANPVIGGLVFEHCSEQWDKPEMAPTLEFVGEHGGDAMRNAKRHHDLFLFPVWNFLGKSRILMAPRVLPKTLVALGLLAVAFLILIFNRVPFYVAADGVFVPRDRAWVFCQMQGEVDEVLIKHGATVKKDETLLTLKNEELRMRIEETKGRIAALNQRKTLIEDSSFDNPGNRSGSISEETTSSIQAEVESLNNQLKLLSKMEAKLKVTSPVDGQVITWDIQRKLNGRTINPNQQLMEVADQDAPWELELDVADRRVGHLLRGARQSDGEPLEVKFSLIADPTKTYQGRVIEVSNAMRLDSENQQVFRVRVEIENDEKILLKQAKSGVAAKIYCGYETSMGYLWFHDVPETIRRHVLFYISG